MKRLTTPHEAGAPAAAHADTAIERLRLYEDFHEDLLRQQEALADELEALRAAGKKNSARFREKLGEKLMVSNTLLLLKFHGIE